MWHAMCCLEVHQTGKKIKEKVAAYSTIYGVSGGRRHRRCSLATTVSLVTPGSNAVRGTAAAVSRY